MGLIKCPDCGKMISDQSSICIGCGKPMTEKFAGALPPSPNRIEQQKEMRNKSALAAKQRKFFSWKSFVAAFIIAFIANIFVASVSGSQPAKDIWWTVMWIYFSIEAWKYWRWKALLPYPLFILVSVIL